MDQFDNIKETPFRSDLKTGQAVDGYEIQKLLGEGTFGIVYKVRKNGKLLALKILKLWEVHPQERKKLIKRFAREFRCGQIESPHLIKSLDYGQYKGNPYFVMELCPKGNLSKYINNRPSLRITDQIAYEILLGLRDLHEHGVYHRDIKPHNILFDQDERVKLSDFGIAGFKNQRMTVKNILGHTKDVFGTYAYIAPEQFDKRTAFKSMNAVTDIYSFGVTMYEFFTNGFPFGSLEDEAELVQYMKRAKNGQWQDISSFGIPENWVRILEGCLDPDYRNKRFQDVNSIIRLLGYRVDIDYARIETRDETLLGLKVTHGEENGRIFDFSSLLNQEEGIITIGWLNKKSPGKNMIEIAESGTAYISTHHATIEKLSKPVRWFIRDGQRRKKSSLWNWYSSTNGVVVNSTKIDTAGVQIKINDIIILGDTVLKVIPIY